MRLVLLKKRIIGTVIIKNGWAVQSFGYNRYLPLGKPECVVENLDRWGADEILILSIDRSSNRLGPDFSLLEKLASLQLETPLIYGGGISTIEEGVKVIGLGADRICVDSLLHDNFNIVRKLSERLGRQAIIGVMPVMANNGIIKWLNYRNKSSLPLKDGMLDNYTKTVSELLLIDFLNEGSKDGFNNKILEDFIDVDLSLILFGGLSDGPKIKKLLANKMVSAIAIGNFLNYKEHSIQNFKREYSRSNIRDSYYKERYSLLNDK